MFLQRFAQEPTEAPSERKLRKARERGQVAKSSEVVATATLLAAYLALLWAGPNTWATLNHFAAEIWGNLLRTDLTLEATQGLVTRVVLVASLAAAPISLAVLLGGLLANYLQVGVLFSLTPVAPDFTRVNPFNFSRVFSRRSLMELLKAIAKLGIIGLIAYQAVAGELTDLPALIDATPKAMLSKVGEVASAIIFRVLLSLMALALLDYLYQRHEFTRQMRMTKQELKEEHKESEGNPEVKGRLRRRQREMSRRRMIADVPKADVVVTNPTHYAVALRYEQGQMEAPEVVAKGAGYMAMKIREIAREHEIPVVENPPLARSLYSAVEAGESIPADLFQAVAEVLAVVYKLRGQL